MRYVYILQCADDTLYTGITTDLDRRVDEHNTSNNGAKYTKARRPVELIWSHQCENRSEATKLELEIKSLSREEKKKIITETDVYSTSDG